MQIFSIKLFSYSRLLVYFVIWQLYISFMSIYSPLGVEWLDWHAQRIYNFAEFLKINGYFSNYGFSIWSKCIDCSLSSEFWTDKIYLSSTLFSNFPYILINELFGSKAFNSYGHFIDKLIIFITGVLIAELLTKLLKKKVSQPYIFFRSILIFIFFIVNPWTYKMILAYWTHIFFIFFFLLGILMFLEKKTNFGLLFFFISGCFDYQSSAGLTLFYIIILFFSYIKKDIFLIKDFVPSLNNTLFIEIKLIISFALPVLIYFLLRFISFNELDVNTGSLLLTRIGISGDDSFNGGILGALQFLGGNRITQCLTNFNSDINSMNLSQKIHIFNCSLSIMSMFLFSVISIIGLLYLQKSEKKYFNIIILPLTFLLLSYTFLLQQSSSVHLMGYSYYFSILFSVGITSLILTVLEKYRFSFTSIILATPITLGIIILCVRVSMLTGING